MDIREIFNQVLDELNKKNYIEELLKHHLEELKFDLSYEGLILDDKTKQIIAITRAENTFNMEVTIRMLERLKNDGFFENT